MLGYGSQPVPAPKGSSLLFQKQLDKERPSLDPCHPWLPFEQWPWNLSDTLLARYLKGQLADGESLDRPKHTRFRP